MSLVDGYYNIVIMGLELISMTLPPLLHDDFVLLRSRNVKKNNKKKPMLAKAWAFLF